MLVQVTFRCRGNFMNQAAYGDGDCRPCSPVELGLSAIELGVLAACLFAAYAAVQLPLVSRSMRWRPTRAVRADVCSRDRLCDVALSPWLCGARRGADRPGHRDSAGLMAVIKAHAIGSNAPGRARDRHRDGDRARSAARSRRHPSRQCCPRSAGGGILGLCVLALAVATWIFLSVPDKPRRPGPARTLRWRHCLERSHLARDPFWRFGPAVRRFRCSTLPTWAFGRPLAAGRAGMDGPARAGVLFLYTFAMCGQRADRSAQPSERAGLPSFLVPIVCLVGMVPAAGRLMLQPSQPSVVLVFAAIGVRYVGPVGYVVMSRCFTEQTGRVSTAVNTLRLVVRSGPGAIGWISILGRAPRRMAGIRTATVGTGVDRGVSGARALVMATAHRRGHAISCDSKPHVALPRSCI